MNLFDVLNRKCSCNRGKFNISLKLLYKSLVTILALVPISDEMYNICI